jgi:hypothetical protein
MRFVGRSLCAGAVLLVLSLSPVAMGSWTHPPDIALGIVGDGTSDTGPRTQAGSDAPEPGLSDQELAIIIGVAVIVVTVIIVWSIFRRRRV